MPRLLEKCLQPSREACESGRDIFASLAFDLENDFEMCRDADLRESIFYLRGGKGLRIPAEWRPLLPERF